MCVADKVLTLYHGSKAGLEGPICLKPGRNRTACDFGCGFYMGDEPTQPRTLICNGANPTLYTLKFDLAGLRVHRFDADESWAMFVAFNRGFLELYRQTSFYRELKRIREENDVIYGKIANDKIFAVMNLFFDGLIGVPALVEALSVLNIGNQYCARTPRAFTRISVVSQRRFSRRECETFASKSERQRRRAAAAADEICRTMRREGEGFQDLVARHFAKEAE